MALDTTHQAFVSHTGEHAFASALDCATLLLIISFAVYMHTITFWGDPAHLNKLVQ